MKNFEVVATAVGRTSITGSRHIREDRFGHAAQDTADAAPPRRGQTREPRRMRACPANAPAVEIDVLGPTPGHPTGLGARGEDGHSPK